MTFHAFHRRHVARIAKRRLVMWAATFVVLMGAPRVHAEPLDARVARVSVSLSVIRGGEKTAEGRRVPRGSAMVVGRATYHLRRSSPGERRLWLLNFAEAIATEPQHLDEIAMRSFFDGPFHAGRMEVLSVTADGVATTMDREGKRRDVLVKVPSGTTAVTVAYRVYVPQRYWPFGCSQRRCSLSGAVAPLPSAPAEGGSWLARGGRVIQPTVWAVDAASFASGLGRVWFGGRALATAGGIPGDRSHGDELVVLDQAAAGQGLVAYPSIFWGPSWRRYRVVVRGVYVTVLETRRRPDGRFPEERFGQLRRDRAGRTLAIATQAIELATRRGIGLAPDTSLVAVTGPLRSAVAQAHPAALMISDQAYQLFPAERFTKFHDVAIARAALEYIARGWITGHHDPSTDVWLSGMLGFALTQLWERERSVRDEFARDILGKLTFMPSVDRFLYSGQASFSSAYFRGSEDDLPLRNHPLLFSHQLPTGRRIHEKLVDLLPPPALVGYYAELTARPDSDPKQLAERHYGYRLDWFFDQWLGPYPKLDYVIDRVRSERIARGWRHHIEIVRDGSRRVIEPVQLLAVERGGGPHYLIWNGDLNGPGETATIDGQTARHVWVLETARPLKTVRLDPRYRLHEVSRVGTSADQTATNFDPRFNNRTPPKIRFLYTGVGFNIAASELANAATSVARLNAFSGFASFEGSLQRDLRRTGSMHAFKDRETIAAVAAGVSFYFLEKVNRRKRRLRIRVAGSLSQLARAGLDDRAGGRVTQSLSIADDTRRYGFWPERGHRLSLGVATQQVSRAGDDDRYNVRAQAAWQQLWRIAHGHVLAQRLSLKVMAPIASAPEYRSLHRLGGIGGLSGYLADEVFGRAVAHAQLEYRHVFTPNLGINLFHLAWLRRLGGAAFGGVATVSSCDNLSRWFGSQNWYGQVGYGMMASVGILGVTPQLIRLDAAVPLAPRSRQRTCLGEIFPGYLAETQGLAPERVHDILPRFSINLTFAQPF